VTPQRTRRTVLVVEDAIAVRNMLEDFLSLYGYDVLVASHPDTAFKRLKQSSASLDAMILDIGLDDNRSGIEVLELMRLDDRFVSLPVVVLTGLSLTTEEEDCIRRNQAHLLHKEFTQPLNVVLIVKTNLRTQAQAHVILCSSDLTLA